MSGFEIAGVVLGAFPLVLKAMSSYVKGCQKFSGECHAFQYPSTACSKFGWQTDFCIQDMWHYKEPLESYQLQLDTEYQKYFNTCKHLLQVLPVTDNAQSLLKPATKEAGGVSWRSAGLEDYLKPLGYGNTASIWKSNVGELKKLLDEVENILPNSPVSGRAFLLVDYWADVL